MLSIVHCLLLPLVQAAASKLVPAPNGGLSSQSNYFLHDDGKALHQIQANLTIQKDFVTSDTGAAFCLNGYAPALDKSAIVYQQICIESFPPGSNLWCVLTTFTRTNVSFGQQFELAGLDDRHTIPAGTEMVMSFTTDKDGTVTGAKFRVIVDGKPSTKEIHIKKNRSTAKADRVTGKLTAFKFNIGGTSDTGSFSGGTGTVGFSSDNTIAVTAEQPRLLPDEIAQAGGNSAYSQMFEGKSKSLPQNFGVF